jgi:RNA polymerase sigma-70 factor (ECF subfamily)
MGPADTTDGGESDEALMLAYAGGSATAFERLYQRHKGGTYRYLLRQTSDRSTAEELHQDVWLRVVRARDRYTPEARFATWLYTLARHRLIDHWRSRSTASTLSLDDDGGEVTVGLAAKESASNDDPLQCVMDAQVGGRFLAALAGIPPAQRDAFLLHVEGGLSVHDVGEATGASAETVKSRLRYAYRRLRAALEDLQ